MFEVGLSYEQNTMCPKCGATLYKEVCESERKVYVLCEKSDCGYEDLLSYEYLKFTFVYRDEFSTEITAKNLEDAIKQLNIVAWKRTGYHLWQDFLSAEYSPVCELNSNNVF